MFGNLFNPDSDLMRTMAHITDCIFFSLFWILGCIPVVTAGASFAALYDATYRGVRRGEKNGWQRFLQVFRKNWKAGIGPTLVFFAVMWALVMAGVALWNGAVAGSITWLLFSAGMMLLVMAVGVVSYLFPMLSRFENSFAGLLKNTVLLALANMPRTIALGVLNVLFGFLCVRFIFPLFFLPSLGALLSSLLIEPAFKPYMPEEDAA